MRYRIDNTHLVPDCLSFDGVFDIADLHAYAAGSKSNLGTLSQSQMLKAHDCDDFVHSQISEIKGLAAANVFNFQP
jgi:hypothetical protein